MHRHTRCMGVGGGMLLRGVSSCPRGAGLADTPPRQCGRPFHVGARRWPPAVLPAGETPTNKGNTQANLIVHTQAPKTHANTKQQGGISIHVFYCEYVYRLLYGREWLVGAFVCVDVWHHVLQGRHCEAHFL